MIATTTLTIIALSVISILLLLGVLLAIGMIKDRDETLKRKEFTYEMLKKAFDTTSATALDVSEQNIELCEKMEQMLHRHKEELTLLSTVHKDEVKKIWVLAGGVLPKEDINRPAQ